MRLGWCVVWVFQGSWGGPEGWDGVRDLGWCRWAGEVLEVERCRRLGMQERWELWRTEMQRVGP